MEISLPDGWGSHQNGTIAMYPGRASTEDLIELADIGFDLIFEVISFDAVTRTYVMSPDYPSRYSDDTTIIDYIAKRRIDETA